jgi:glycosyltransferase involved in cell wall biosynthesis
MRSERPDSMSAANDNASLAPALPPKTRATVFVVVAAYNEAGAIADVVREVRSEYPNVVVVDDGSTDGTFAEAGRGATYVLRHIVNCGQGAALQTGIEFALRHGAEIVVTFDADGQHDVADVAALVAPIVAGECDVTLGSRFLGSAEGMPWPRRIALRAAVWLTRLMSGVRLTDAHNGLRALSCRAARRIDIRMDRMAHASEIIDQIRDSGLPFREIPVRIRYTPYSLRKGQSIRGGLRILIQYVLGRVVR